MDLFFRLSEGKVINCICFPLKNIRKKYIKIKSIFMTFLVEILKKKNEVSIKKRLRRQENPLKRAIEYLQK